MLSIVADRRLRQNSLERVDHYWQQPVVKKMAEGKLLCCPKLPLLRSHLSRGRVSGSLNVVGPKNVGGTAILISPLILFLVFISHRLFVIMYHSSCLLLLVPDLRINNTSGV